MKRNIRQLLSFAVTVGAVVLVLAVLDWTPGALDPGLLREYPDVASARAQLRLRQVRAPAYFPASVGWPPSRVLAQARPYEAIVLEFRRAGDGETVLTIVQSESRRFRPGEAIPFRAVNERVPVDLRGRAATLEAGTCEDNEPCGRIAWQEDGSWIAVTMKASSPELIRLAESMLH